MRYALFWDIAQSTTVLTDVSGRAVDPILKGKAVLEGLTRENETR
jgi:hypothetical protein